MLHCFDSISRRGCKAAGISGKPEMRKIDRSREPEEENAGPARAGEVNRRRPDYRKGPKEEKAQLRRMFPDSTFPDRSAVFQVRDAAGSFFLSSAISRSYLDLL